MIRALLRACGWPDFTRPKAAPIAVLEAKAKACQAAKLAVRDARRARQKDATYRAHVRAKAAEMAAQMGREWPA